MHYGGGGVMYFYLFIFKEQEAKLFNRRTCKAEHCDIQYVDTHISVSVTDIQTEAREMLLPSQMSSMLL